MQVLEEHGIAYRSLLEEVYPVREYIVQYEEDDLAFVQRLLEHWGVFYFFEHDPDGSTLVLADDSTKQTTAVSEDTVPYSIHRDAKLGSRGAVYGLSRVHRMRSQSIDLKDYNWRTPEVVPEGEAEADASDLFVRDDTAGKKACNSPDPAPI